MTAPKPPAPSKPAPPPATGGKPPIPDAQRLTGDSAKGTSNRALQLRRTLQNQDVDFQVPSGAKLFVHPEQMILIQQPTPEGYIKSHQGRGGTFRFVPISLTIERLNMIFGYGWSFEVVDQGMITVEGKIVSVWVRGFMEIVCADGSRLQRPAFGGSDVEYYSKGPKIGQPLSIADNFKGATSDAIGKAASAFGLWLDLYDKDGDVLKERIAAAEQTEQLLASAGGQAAGNRTVEGRSKVIPNPETGEIPMGSSPVDAAQAARMAASRAQVESDLEAAGLGSTRSATDDGLFDPPDDGVPEPPPPVEETAPARPAPAKPAAPPPATRHAAAAAQPPVARPPVPATPAAPPMTAAAELKALSEKFFDKAARIGWKFPAGHAQAGQPRIVDIKAVLKARGFTGLNTENMEAALSALSDEAGKRRDAAASRQRQAGNGVHV